MGISGQSLLIIMFKPLTQFSNSCDSNFSDPELFDEVTADLVLDQLSYDGYQDDRQKPIGYKFKVIALKLSY